jgi:nitrogen fixation/metabolism regulation signal transduction histidine kinase
MRATFVLLAAGAAFVVAIWLMRSLRRNIAAEADLDSAAAPKLDALPLHLYNTVIQQLKQQKHELQVEAQAEQHRARTTETFGHAVLSNLSCGVLVFGTNGLVKTSNPAAKQILGFASPTGMNAEDVFRGAVISVGHTAVAHLSEATSDDSTDEPVCVADEVEVVLREGSNRRQVEAEYETPAGEKRFLGVTVSPVPAEDGSLLGVACVINDRSELERIRHQQDLQSEVSAEMALQLRTSLATISGYAQQLASHRDPELAKQLATDIADEAAQLERSLGGFLTEQRAAQSAAAGIGSTVS